jgi:hypothetical protein
MRFSDQLGTITCKCVAHAGKPVLFVSHAGGDWQFYCSDSNHDFNDDAANKRDLVLVHIAHLVAQDPSLDELFDLPVDMGAERESVGSPWTRFPDSDSTD